MVKLQPLNSQANLVECLSNFVVDEPSPEYRLKSI
jgi:hypothetical protein